MDMSTETEPATVAAMLEGDDRDIERLGESLTELLLSGKPAAQSALAALNEAIGRHFRVEELVLFPLLESRAHLDGPTASMRREHRRIEATLEALGRALEAADVERARKVNEALAELLDIHHRGEVVLAARADRFLGPAEVRHLWQAFRRH
jgi:hemerythrin-like domain-containing protein